jgi:hypothetical protein
MTRDAHRMACAKAIEAVLLARWDPASPLSLLVTALAVLDALPTAEARVVPGEVTKDMVDAGTNESVSEVSEGDLQRLWRAMSRAGDLTNPPEAKP